MHKVSLANGKSFICESGQTLLEAAQKSNLNLPYSCKTGRCSTCKARVISGVTHAKVDELGLADSRNHENEILTCVRTAESDVQLDVEDLGDIQVPASKILPCRISSLKFLAKDVIEVMLRTPPAQDFQFLAGQYVDIIGPNAVRRSYSIANYFQVKGELALHIKNVPGGVLSQYWFERAKVNDLLRINGPFGTFFLRNCKGKDLVFLATGTGIAPVKSIVESLVSLSSDQQPQSVSIFWGGRHRSDLYWQPNKNYGLSRVNFIPVLSRPDLNWEGATGHVQNVLLEAGIPLMSSLIYACGSENMIKSAYSILTKKGLPPDQFFSDAFVCTSNP